MLIVSNNPKPMSQILQYSSLSRSQAIRFLIAAVIGGSLLGLGGLTLTGTMIAVVIAAPALVLFSPIIIPAVVAVALVTTGFMFSGGCLAAAVAWIFHYVTGKHLVAVDLLDYLKVKIGSMVRGVKERAKECENA